MRELSFKGYLLSQLQFLSDCKSTSLYAFSKMAKSNARLKDALSLYLVLYTEKDLRNRLLKKYDYLNESGKRLDGLNKNNIGIFLKADNLSEYLTVYNNYLYQHSRKQQEDKLKAMMCRKISELKVEKQVTNYRIYKELNLNPGNANAFLKNGDTSKVSLDTARRILAFVNGIRDYEEKSVN